MRPTEPNTKPHTKYETKELKNYIKDKTTKFHSHTQHIFNFPSLFLPLCLIHLLLATSHLHTPGNYSTVLGTSKNTDLFVTLALQQNIASFHSQKHNKNSQMTSLGGADPALPHFRAFPPSPPGKSYMEHSNQVVMAMLADIEQELELKAGALSNDEILLLQLQQLSQNSQFPPSRLDVIQVISDVFSHIKLGDRKRSMLFGSIPQIYGSPNSLLYEPESPLSDRIPLYLESACSIQTRQYESDFDDTASLMGCDSSTRDLSPSILDFPPEDLDDKFKLHKVLEELHGRHFRIGLNFHAIDMKLVHIKRQNACDLEFLDKLVASSDIIRERMHDMRAEIQNMIVEVELLREEAEATSEGDKPNFQPISILNFESNVADVVKGDPDHDHLHRETPLGINGKENGNRDENGKREENDIIENMVIGSGCTVLEDVHKVLEETEVWYREDGKVKSEGMGGCSRVVRTESWTAKNEEEKKGSECESESESKRESETGTVMKTESAINNESEVDRDTHTKAGLVSESHADETVLDCEVLDCEVLDSEVLDSPDSNTLNRHTPTEQSHRPQSTQSRHQKHTGLVTILQSPLHAALLLLSVLVAAYWLSMSND